MGTITLHVKANGGGTVSVDAEGGWTVGRVKEEACKELGLESRVTVLIFEGEDLTEGEVNGIGAGDGDCLELRVDNVEIAHCNLEKTTLRNKYDRFGDLVSKSNVAAELFAAGEYTLLTDLFTASSDYEAATCVKYLVTSVRSTLFEFLETLPEVHKHLDTFAVFRCVVLSCDAPSTEYLVSQFGTAHFASNGTLLVEYMELPRNNASTVKQLIGYGCVASTYCSMLYLAKHSALHIEVLEVLLEAGMLDLSAVNEAGQTHLMVAAQSIHFASTVPFLLRCMSSVTAVDRKGRTALHLLHMTNTAQPYDEFSPCITMVDKAGWTPFMYAIKRFHVSDLIYTLSVYFPHDTGMYDRCDRQGDSLLSIAAARCVDSPLPMLLEHAKGHLEPDAFERVLNRRNYKKLSPLQVALKGGAMCNIEALLEAGCCTKGAFGIPHLSKRTKKLLILAERRTHLLTV
eukprot:TRINITY_DN30747_c0_g1_i1.p1 TRINITY_DN30747_c0_g1~~TRINITY_DN30747_c0_g1_i1.p1  ORF type:complete len:475 (+),score=56.94 TRINITY_DN30747_c0_g1_i1:52-1425(+)